MGNVVFYRDAKDTFECDIRVEGTSLSESRARLLLQFPNRSYIFEGSINNKGHVKIDIPTLPDISDDGGHAVLEVIAESTFFEAWNSDFDLHNKKEITVQEVSISNDNKKIVVENISKEKPRKAPTQRKKTSIYTERCTSKNKRFAKKVFDRYKTLTESEKSEVKKAVKKFRPNQLVEQWGESVFRESDELYAKMCMMELQTGLKKLD